MLSLRPGPRRWHGDATSRHGPGSANLPPRPGRAQRAGTGWAGGLGSRGGGVATIYPSMASSTSCLIPLPSNTASCEAPASNTALNPKVASCLAALTWVQGQWQLRGCCGPPTPRRGGGTYVDGAIAEAVHNPLVASPRLCAGQWPDPNGGGGHRGVAGRGPRGAPLCPCPRQEGPHCVPEPFASALTSARLSGVSLCPPRRPPAPLRGSFGEQRAEGQWVPPRLGVLPADTPGQG